MRSAHTDRPPTKLRMARQPTTVARSPPINPNADPGSPGSATPGVPATESSAAPISKGEVISRECRAAAPMSNRSILVNAKHRIRRYRSHRSSVRTVPRDESCNEISIHESRTQAIAIEAEAISAIGRLLTGCDTRAQIHTAITDRSNNRKLTLATPIANGGPTMAFCEGNSTLSTRATIIDAERAAWTHLDDPEYRKLLTASRRHPAALFLRIA